MTGYVHKVDADLDVGKVVGGPNAGTMFIWQTTYLNAKGYRKDGAGNKSYYNFPLGVTVDETMSFFARFKLKTQPTNMNGTNSSLLFCCFNLSTDNYTTVNNISFYISGKYPTGVGGRVAAWIAYSSGTTLASVGTYDLSVATNYIIDLSFDATTHILTVIVRAPDESVLATLFTVSIGANTFDADSIGLCSYTPVGGTASGSFYEHLEFTEIHANSGTTYEAPVIGGSPGKRMIAVI